MNADYRRGGVEERSSHTSEGEGGMMWTVDEATKAGTAGSEIT